jgi:membrane-bound lytic murein transglycosylase D
MCAGLCLVAQVLVAAELPRPQELADDVAFWRRVYSEISTREGYIHDDRELGIVYETVRFRDGDPAQQKRIAGQVVERYRGVLRHLARGGRPVDAEAARVLALWGGERADRGRLRAAADRVRFQRGQSDRTRAGLVRSGRWREQIEASLRRHGVPVELAALPLVESAFDPGARSHVGASGLWQFMPGTAKLYLPMDQAVDGRHDPFLASDAAARLLADNFRVTGTWPLAITSYNHGANGMKRARDQLGSDFHRIWRDYRSPSFGFASRNFYVSFLAASDIFQDPERFFGKLHFDAPDRSIGVPLPARMTLDAAARALGVGRKALADLNPALLPAAVDGRRAMPAGYVLRVPDGRRPATELAALLRAGPHVAAAGDVPGEGQHRVRRGETLSQIAARHGVSLRELTALNGIGRSGLIRAGQVLDLPHGGGRVAAATAVASPAAASGPAAQAATAAGPVRHVVRSGETLSQIASRYGVALRDLMADNGIRRAGLIHAGQVLDIAQRGDRGGTVAKADTAAAMPETTATAAAVPPDEPLPPEAHVVRRGETLARIARRYGIDEAALAAHNGLRDPDALRAGQRLRVAGATVLQAAVPAAEPARPAAPSAGGAAGSGEVAGPVAAVPVAAAAGAVQAAAAMPAGTTPVAAAPPGDATAAAGSTGSDAVTYVVRRGDSLWKIARRFRVSERDLLALNQIPSKHRLLPGQTLVVGRRSSDG